MVPSPRCLVLALVLARAAGAEQEGVCPAGGCKGSSGLQDTNPEGYYWRRRGGGNEVITSVPSRGPTNLSKGPTWSWANDFDEQVRHSPLIDEEKNIYVATAVRIRKFNEHGAVEWTFETTRREGKMTSSPAIYKGTLYALAHSYPAATATIYALDMQTGQKKWQKPIEQVFQFGDAHSLFVYNDTIIFPMRAHLVDRPVPGGSDGNNQVRAVTASDGTPLWEYTADDIMWNLMVSTPGDGTLLFASQCGGVYRINWAGEQIWRAGRPNPGHWCGCGGGVLGPNGLFYAEFNDAERGQGVVAAHRVSDGGLVWERTWPHQLKLGGWQYPGVGRLAPDGRLAVVAPIGGITNIPHFPGLGLLSYEWVPFWLKNFWYEKVYLKSALVRRYLGVPVLPNIVVAMDAETGADIWQVTEQPWDRHAAAGDEERYVERYIRHVTDPEREDTAWCLPDPQGIPFIAGDGTVYMSSSHTGDLASVRDNDGNGVIDPSEISIFKTGIGFLNGPSLAPGMVVAAPCWGPMYVFKD